MKKLRAAPERTCNLVTDRGHKVLHHGVRMDKDAGMQAPRKEVKDLRRIKNTSN